MEEAFISWHWLGSSLLGLGFLTRSTPSLPLACTRNSTDLSQLDYFPITQRSVALAHGILGSRPIQTSPQPRYQASPKPFIVNNYGVLCMYPTQRLNKTPSHESSTTQMT